MGTLADVSYFVEESSYSDFQRCHPTDDCYARTCSVYLTFFAPANHKVYLVLCLDP